MTYRKNVIPARIIITKNQQYITYFLIFFYFFTYTTLFPDLKTPRNTPPMVFVCGVGGIIYFRESRARPAYPPPRQVRIALNILQ